MKSHGFAAIAALLCIVMLSGVSAKAQFEPQWELPGTDARKGVVICPAGDGGVHVVRVKLPEGTNQPVVLTVHTQDWDFALCEEENFDILSFEVVGTYDGDDWWRFEIQEAGGVLWNGGWTNLTVKGDGGEEFSGPGLRFYSYDLANFDSSGTDGKVNLADVSAFSANIWSNLPSDDGDFNLDGVTNLSDIALLAAHMDSESHQSCNSQYAGAASPIATSRIIQMIMAPTDQDQSRDDESFGSLKSKFED